METLFYFLFWAVLIVVMMRFGCGAHVMGGRRGKGRDSRASENGALRWIAPDTDVDPVCGRTIATKAAKSAIHDGTVYYFCSNNCRTAFEADPDRYRRVSVDRESQAPERSHV